MSLSYIRRIVVSVFVHILCRNISISQWVVCKISFSYLYFPVCIFSCVCVDDVWYRLFRVLVRFLVSFSFRLFYGGAFILGCVFVIRFHSVLVCF